MFKSVLLYTDIITRNRELCAEMSEKRDMQEIKLNQQNSLQLMSKEDWSTF